MGFEQSVLAVNEYKQEKIEDSLMSVIMSCINIIINEPGTIPEYSHLGVGLDSKRHMLVDDSNSIEVLSKLANKQLAEIYPSLEIKAIFTVTQSDDGSFYTNINLYIPTLQTSITASYINKDKISILSKVYKEKNFNIS